MPDTPQQLPPQPTSFMEDEIDLRIYLDILIKWWREITLFVGLVVLAVAVYVWLLPNTYEATALVATIRSKSEINFEPRYVSSVEETSDSLKLRIEGYVSQVRNPNIAQKVLTEHSEHFQADETTGEPPSAAAMMNQVSGEYLPATDVIAITVSSDDPQSAAVIANAWAEAFVSEINETYGEQNQPLQVINVQVDNARQVYNDADTRLVEFQQQENRVDELNRALLARTTVLSDYVTAETDIQRLFLEEQQKTGQTMVTQWFQFERENRLNALGKEQDLRRQLFDTFAQAAIDSQVTVVKLQTEDRLAQLQTAYQRQARYRSYLADARALQQALAFGSQSSIASSQVALQLLKAQIFAGSDSLAANLQLQMSTTDEGASLADTQQDVEALVDTVAQALITLDTDIQTQSEQLLAGNNYRFTDSLQANLLSLTSETASLTNAELLALAAASDSTLLQTQLLQYYLDLFQVGPLADLTADFSRQSPVEDRLATLYQTLYDQAPPISSAAVSNTADSALRVRSDTALGQSIAELEDEVRQLQAEILRLENRATVLEHERELAWETFKTLANKQAEVTVASEALDSEVRFAVPATVPNNPVSHNALISLAVAGAVALMLAVFGVFLLDYLGVEPFFSSGKQPRSTSPSGRVV